MSEAPRGGDGVSPKSARVISLSGLEARALLEARCARRQAAAVLSGGGRIICASVLQTLDGRALTLTLEGPTARRLRTQPAVTVSFSDGAVAHFFVTRVQAFHRATKDAPARLELELPELVVGVETKPGRITRHSFRIPLAEELLSVVIEDETSQQYQATALDVSLGGMLLELRQNVPPSLALGCRLHVRVAHEGAKLKLTAEVRSVGGGALGICFIGFGEGKDLKPPPAYERLVARLERRWLRRTRN